MGENEPATDRQKKKLRWLSIAVKKGLTKAQASALLDAAEDAHPEREEAYQTAKDREEEAWILGEFVNHEDWCEMGDYKKLTKAQALTLRDYFVRRSIRWENVDRAQMARIILKLFPDRLKMSRARRSRLPKGCVLLFCMLLTAFTVLVFLR